MRLKILLLTLAGSLMIFSNGYAQQPGCNLTVSGHVYISDTAQLDARGATIRFPTLKKNGATGDDGNFQIPGICPGKQRIIITYQGYKTIDTVFNIIHDLTLNFLLFSNTQDLTSVTVVGEILKKDQITTAIKSVLSGAALDATRGLSLGESLKSIAGVNSLQTGPSISKPVIHGVYSNRVLIMNNGVRQEGQNWGNDHAPEIDPFIATKITVIKGAASIRYGSDAVGGVILLDPKDLPAKPGIDGELNLVGMTNGRVGVASGMIEGAGGGKWEGLSWRLQGTIKQAGNSQTANYYLVNTGFNENDYSATLQYNKAHYGGSLYFSQFNTKIGIALASVADNASDLQQSIARGRPVDNGFFRYAFGRPDQTVNHMLAKASGYIDLPNAGGRLEAVYAYQRDSRKEYDANPSDNSDTALNTNGIPDLNFQLNTSTADLIWEHRPIANKVTGSIGLNFITHENIQQGTAYQQLIPNFVDYGGGAFAIEKYAAGKWVLEAGARYDYRWMQAYEYNPTTVVEDRPTYTWREPTLNIGATYKFNDHFSGDYNFGSAWRAPQVIELFANGVHQSAAAWEFGDSSLTLEQAYNNNLSFTYNDSHLIIEAGAYVNYFHHYIYPQPDLNYITTIQGTFPAFTYTQVNALFEGADLSINYTFAKNLTLISKTSIVRARNLAIHDWLIGVPADRFDNSLRYEWPAIGKWKHIFFEANNLIVAKQSRVPPNSDFAPPPPGYMLWGASAGFSVPLAQRELKVSLSVTNLTNVDYRDYLDRFRYYFADLGRNIVLRLVVPFDIKKQK
ncbi:MAG TPA: TonB-dependent receptor [Puia sp.]|jgi:iron complex outermembrane receptor protein|nr:TonB-dependent receptor [Puia sp.]